MKKQAKKGFGLLEVLLTLVVSMVLLIVGISYYQSVSREQKINQTLLRLQSIRGAVVQLTLNQPGTVENNTKLKQALGKTLSSATLTNPWASSSPFNIGALTMGKLCATIAVSFCGIDTNSIKALENKFYLIYPLSQGNLFTQGTVSVGGPKSSGNCVTATLCIQ